MREGLGRGGGAAEGGLRAGEPAGRALTCAAGTFDAPRPARSRGIPRDPRPARPPARPPRHTIQTGGLYGGDAVEPPFVAGHDGVAVVVKVRRGLAGGDARSTRCAGLEGQRGRERERPLAAWLPAAWPCSALSPSSPPALPRPRAPHPQVGPGVKALAENDWVVPAKPHLGTWRSLAGGWVGGWVGGRGQHGAGLAQWVAERACWHPTPGAPPQERRAPPSPPIPFNPNSGAREGPAQDPGPPPSMPHPTSQTSRPPPAPPPAVAREKDLLRIPADLMPLEQAALLRELITAYRLLEDHAGLKVG